MYATRHRNATGSHVTWLDMVLFPIVERGRDAITRNRRRRHLQKILYRQWFCRGILLAPFAAWSTLVVWHSSCLPFPSPPMVPLVTGRYLRHDLNNTGMSVTFPTKRLAIFASPRQSPPAVWNGGSLGHDFGGLNVSLFDENNKGRLRSISTLDDHVLERYRTQLLDDMDRTTERELPPKFEPADCHTPLWAKQQFPTCNTFHEIPPPSDILGRGSFREGLRVFDAIVLKRLRLEQPVARCQLDSIRKEALIMERLSDAPTIATIYGYCGGSVYVEAAHDLEATILPKNPYHAEPGLIEATAWDALQKQQRILSFNNLTITEKLDMAIQMATSLAELHGFAQGAIVNDDVLPRQWLVTDDHRVVLNDFNLATVLPVTNDSRQSCRVFRSNGGRLRAPEEYEGSYVDESADVFPFGSVLYSLLTGLYPFPEIPNLYQAKIESKVLGGEFPLVHSHLRNSSFVARRLVETMEACFTLDPKDRIDIFQVLKHLHQAKALNE